MVAEPKGSYLVHQIKQQLSCSHLPVQSSCFFSTHPLPLVPEAGAFETVAFCCPLDLIVNRTWSGSTKQATKTLFLHHLHLLQAHKNSHLAATREDATGIIWKARFFCSHSLQSLMALWMELLKCLLQLRNLSPHKCISNAHGYQMEYHIRCMKGARWAWRGCTGRALCFRY